jgi:hypothetical protein
VSCAGRTKWSKWSTTRIETWKKGFLQEHEGCEKLVSIVLHKEWFSCFAKVFAVAMLLFFNNQRVTAKNKQDHRLDPKKTREKLPRGLNPHACTDLEVFSYR